MLPCVAMSSLRNPPGLVSASMKRRHRHKKLAAQLSWDKYMSSVEEQNTTFTDSDVTSSDTSLGSSIHCADELECNRSAWYIGEIMCDSAVQTDLSTNPIDELAYCVDPVALVEAAVHNAMINLKHEVDACLAQADEVFQDITPDRNDVCEPIAEDLPEISSEASLCAVEQDIRLCTLRLDKVRKQWSKLHDTIKVEMVSMHNDEEDEFFSLPLEEATQFCEYIGELLQSVHTSGAWSNGLAVHDIYMTQFGTREGTHCVEQHMRILEMD